MRACSAFVLIIACLCGLPALADTIHLKNGRTIYADRVRQTGQHVEYDVGDNSYAIPKSAVAHVQSGGMAPMVSSAASTSGNSDLPAFIPNEARTEVNLPVSVVRSGQVDPTALDTLERTGDHLLIAAGYFTAGQHEEEGGRRDQARRYFSRALNYAPDDPVILMHYAAALVGTGDLAEATSAAEHATRVDPNSADAWAILGFAQFRADRTEQAIRSWKRSLQLRPDPIVQKYLAKAQRESSTEANFSESDTGHFTLRYQGRQSPESFRRELLQTLEADYQDLASQMSVVPRNSIAVVLYTEEQFFDVTQAPAWTAALNDGKLRIPISGLTSVTPELARVLHHELAHSFINDVSRGRCPQWLHEGIAQLVEPRSSAGFGRRLGEVFRAGHAVPFNGLEGNFVSFSAPEARLAYDESLAAAEYIRDTYGMDDLRRILERIGQGSTPEAALRATIHTDYGQLETEVGKFLKDKYGE